MLQRWFSHLVTTHFTLRRCFPPQLLADIDAAISASEQTHRERAREIFGQLGMASTAGHNGILVYVLLAERAIEIVADSGFDDKVPGPVWEDICVQIGAAFRNDDYGPGALQAIRRLNELAAACFPAGTDDRNELPNQPVLL
jgi:uncharacterized membrane protein